MAASADENCRLLLGASRELRAADAVKGMLLTCFYGGSSQEWAAPSDTVVRIGAFSVYSNSHEVCHRILEAQAQE